MFRSDARGGYFLLGLVTVGIVATLAVVGTVLYMNVVEKATKEVAKTEDTAIKQAEPEVKTGEVKNLEEVEFVTGTDKFGYWESDENGFKLYKLEEQLKISWLKGAKRLSKNDAIKLLTNIVPTYTQILEDVKKSPPTNDGLLYCKGESYCELPVFKAGTVESPAKYKGMEVYHVIFSFAFEMGDGRNILTVVYDNVNKKFILISKDNTFSCMTEKISSDNASISDVQTCGLSSDGYDSFENFPYLRITYQKWFSGYIDSEVALFQSPRTLGIPSTKDRLVFSIVEGCGKFMNIGGCGEKSGIKNDLSVINASLYENDLVFKHPIYGNVYYNGSCYYLVNQNGAVVQYELLPPFAQSHDHWSADMIFDADIEWLNEEVAQKFSSAQFIIGSVSLEEGGCGSGIKACDNIVNKAAWFDESKLVQIGTHEATGDKVYELKDKRDNPYYRKLLEVSYFRLDGEDYVEKETNNNDPLYLKRLEEYNKKLFVKFIDEIPVIFWKDHVGNWRVYLKSRVAPLGECGKPVIYLYPTKDTDVNVKVEPTGGLTKVEPFYPAGGWSVRATPQSDLFNYADKQTYPYLFWEGKAYNMITPDYGFVLKREEVGEKMKNILARLGLNKKETADFLEFWQPKLEVKPYVFVTFIPQSEFDKLAPLTVTPAPDKVIRVFMDYKPLQNPIQVREPRIVTPVRTGFTVVEWGGRLR